MTNSLSFLLELVTQYKVSLEVLGVIIVLVLLSRLAGAGVELYGVRRLFLVGLLARLYLRVVFFKYLFNPFLKGIKGVFRCGLVELLDALKETLYIQLPKGKVLAFRWRAAGVINLDIDRYIVSYKSPFLNYTIEVNFSIQIQQYKREINYAFLFPSFPYRLSSWYGKYKTSSISFSQQAFYLLFTSYILFILY